MQPRRREDTKKKTFLGLRAFVPSWPAFLRVSTVALAGVVFGLDAMLTAQDTDRGKQTFARVGCYQCHGREAQGASTGPRLGPDPMPLVQFTRAVRTPRAEMPPYSPKILSDAELADIYAYVSSRARPRK